MAALEPCCMFFGAKLAISSKMIALKIVKWIIAGKKKDFADLYLWWMPSHWQVFLLPANVDSNGMTSKTRPGCQDSFKMAASAVTSFTTNLFWIAGTSEAETSVSGKAESFLLWAKPKNVSFLEWPSPLSIIKDQLRALVAYGVVRNKLNDSSSKRLKNVRSLT